MSKVSQGILSQLAITVVVWYPGLSEKIAEKLERSKSMVLVHARNNYPFGKLTSESILDIIEKDSGLTRDQILVYKEEENT